MHTCIYFYHLNKYYENCWWSNGSMVYSYHEIDHILKDPTLGFHHSEDTLEGPSLSDDLIPITIQV